MIIWLASYPRSGNTYFRIIVNRLYGVETFSIYTDRRIPEMWELVGNRPLDVPISQMQAAAETFIVKTHELPHGESRAMYLVRDGRDALVSHARFIISFGSAEGAEGSEAEFRRVLGELISSDDAFGGWSGNVNRWLDRRDTCMVRFDDLITQPEQTVRSALQKVQYPVRPTAVPVGVLPDFAELHRRLPRFFRRGEVGSWRAEMADDLHELFWRRHGATMDRLGYAR